MVGKILTPWPGSLAPRLGRPLFPSCHSHRRCLPPPPPPQVLLAYFTVLSGCPFSPTLLAGVGGMTDSTCQVRVERLPCLAPAYAPACAPAALLAGLKLLASCARGADWGLGLGQLGCMAQAQTFPPLPPRRPGRDAAAAGERGDPRRPGPRRPTRQDQAAHQRQQRGNPAPARCAELAVRGQGGVGRGGAGRGGAGRAGWVQPHASRPV